MRQAKLQPPRDSGSLTRNKVHFGENKNKKIPEGGGNSEEKWVRIISIRMEPQYTSRDEGS